MLISTFSPSVKEHIVRRVLDALTSVSRAFPRLQPPAEAESYACGGLAHSQLILVAGPEQEVARDDLGQTLQFDLHVKLHFPPAVPAVPCLEPRHAELAAAVIKALEAPALLAGLGRVVIGAEEQTFIRSGLSKVYGPWLRVAVQYARRRGAPEQAYEPEEHGEQGPAAVAVPQRLEIV